MLNKLLYEALGAVCRTPVQVIRPGELGQFSCPPPRVSNLLRRQQRYVQVTDWGEVYQLACPVCQDHKQRLYVSHLFGCYVEHQGHRFDFGRVYVCHNEHCDLWPYFRNLNLPPLPAPGKPGTYTRYSIDEVPLPPGNVSLISPDVPARVLEYLRTRRFDPSMLARNYDVRAVFQGGAWAKDELELVSDNPAEPPAVVDGSPVPVAIAPDPEVLAAGRTTGDPVLGSVKPAAKKSVFYEDRLLIPVYNRRKLAGWQARRCDDGDSKFKYLNHPRMKKSRLIYNLDAMLYQDDIVITEGVTKVWRIGQHAGAIFGHHPSEEQKYILKQAWRTNGSCVVLLDGEDEAQEQARALCAFLREDSAFPRGVFNLVLPNRLQADAYSESEINGIIRQRRLHG